MNHKEANMGTAKGDTDMTKRARDTEREEHGGRERVRDIQTKQHRLRLNMTHDTQVRHSNKNLKMNKITKRTGNTKD